MPLSLPHKYLLLSAGITLISACGGGSSNSGTTPVNPPTPVTVNGKAADGYLVNARVCIDVNSNLQCDSNEPSTTTGAGGSYVLEVPQNLNNAYSILVEAIANQTIDEDNPGTPISRSYTLSAPAGVTFISPFSSLVQNAMRNNAALTQEDAATQIRNALYLAESTNILDDYIESEDTETHQYARFVTDLLANAIEQSQTNAGDNGLSDTQFGPVLNAIFGRIIAQAADIADAIDNDDDASTIEIVGSGDSIEDLILTGGASSELADASALLPEGVQAWSINSQLFRNVLANNRSPAEEFWDGSDWQDSYGEGPLDPDFNLVWAGETDGWISQANNTDCAVTATADTPNALTVTCGVKQYQVAFSQSDLAGIVISDFLAARLPDGEGPGGEVTLPEDLADDTTAFSADAYRLDGKATTTSPQLSLWECNTRGTEPTIEDCDVLFDSTTLATLASRDNTFEWGYDESVDDDIYAYLAGDPSQTASGALMRLAASENEDTQIGTWQKLTVNGQDLILVTTQDNDFGYIAAEKMAFVEVEGNMYVASYIPEQSVMPLQDFFFSDGAQFDPIYLNQQAADEIETVIGGYLNAAFGETGGPGGPGIPPPPAP